MSRLNTLLTKISAALSASSYSINAWGRAFKIIRRIDGQDYEVPACFTGSSNGRNEYREMLPDKQLGNFSFFWLMDPQRYSAEQMHAKGRYTCPLAIIMWFDLRTVLVPTTDGVYPRDNVEDLKESLIGILNGVTLPSGRLTINKIYEQAENIYREFTIDEVDNQFLMHPYAGFRFECELIFDEPC